MYKFSLVVIACTVLVGCSSDTDLDQWMAQQKQEQQSKPALFLRKYDVNPPAPFDPYPFHADDLTSPFDPNRILQALGKNPDVAQTDQKLLEEWKIEQDRDPQPLESFPLETMTMVGFIQKNQQAFALLKVGESVYPVKVGEYLGLDKGKIQQITETSIDLRELVQTGQGNVVERFKTLRLQEDEA